MQCPGKMRLTEIKLKKDEKGDEESDERMGVAEKRRKFLGILQQESKIMLFELLRRSID